MAEGPLCDKSLLDSYINYVRVTLATIIIKNKGEHPDGYSYALALQKSVLSKQNDWKAEYYKLKDELLRLKQNQVLKDLHVDCDKVESGPTPMDILTPPLTQATQSSQASSSIAAAVVASPNCTSQLDECPNMFTKLSSHHVFLTRIASLKELTTGSLVVLNSGATSVVIDTYLDCVCTLKDSLCSDFSSEPNVDETKTMRRQLTRCMVELLKMSMAVSRCGEVMTSLEDFYTRCLIIVFCPPTVKTAYNINNVEEVIYILRKFSEFPHSAEFLCNYIMGYIVNFTELLVTAKFSDFIRDSNLLTQMECIPQVSNLLLTINRIRNKDNDHVPPILAMLDLINLREKLDMTLAKFPLYTVHMREVLSRTGHRLLSDGAFNDSIL